MKKLLLFSLMVWLFASCDSPNSSNQNADNKPAEIGSAQMDGMKAMAPLFVGEISNQQIWLDYIQAHNDKNLEKIAAINADDWANHLGHN